MANLQGTNISAPILPFTGEDKFATHDAVYGKGGHRTVTTLIERNNISLERRTVLMTVAVVEDGKTYKLKTNPVTSFTLDTDWDEVPNGTVGTTDYTQLINKPLSSVSNIDDAVMKKHLHENGIVLTKFTEVNGVIYYNDKPIASATDTFGGEFATKEELLAYASPKIGYSYIVTSDESQNYLRTYYQYITGGIWQPMGTFSDILLGEGGNVYNLQWNSPDVITVGQEKILPTPYTTTFNVISPTILKFLLGEQDVVKSLNEFNNGSASSFKYDSNFVEFVEDKMQLKTLFPLITTNNNTNPDCIYSESVVSVLDYKKIEGLVI